MAIVVSVSSISSVALYTSLVDAVYAITKRPDLVQETAMAIRKATMKAHLADFWKNDLTAVIYTPPVASPTDYSYRYAIDLTDITLFPLYRKVASIKEYVNPITGRELQFKELDADRILDGYQLEDINYWYQAGGQAHVRCSKNLAQIQVHYWKYPNVLPGSYLSWIAVEFPDLIIEEACAYIYRMIGKDAEAGRMTAQFAENIHLITMAQVA